MDALTVSPLDEAARLRRCLNDLVSIIALPAIWTGGEPQRIIDTLLDALAGMLGAAFVFARLNDADDGAPVEVGRISDTWEGSLRASEIGNALDASLADDCRTWPPVARVMIGAVHVSVASARLGLRGNIGAIVVGSERIDFPGDTERLILDVAANQAALRLQQARLLSEQRRVAAELDEHVAQRTRDLRLSEARKTAILGSALDCIVTIDHEGCITEFNPAAERTFGYRRDEILGQQLADVIVPPALRDRHRQGFARYLATGESRVLGKRIEMTAVRADGTEFPVELAITRIPLDGPPSFTGYLRDITERKRAEEELRRSEAFLAEAQQLSQVGSFSWRVATDEIMWSEQLYRIFEIDRDVRVTLEVIGARVHAEDLPAFKEKIEQCRRDGSDVQLEIRLQMPDGTIKYVHVVAHCRGDRGQFEYIGAVQDVTQRRRSEAALANVRSELASVARVTSLGVLTASIAHEVNQPLAGIITNASTCLRMLGADPPDVCGARETARRTIRDGNRASDVITRLRTLFSKKEFALESLDLNEATREVIALTLSDLQRQRVVLQSDLADDLPMITGDRIQLQQVILNLIRNASDAMVDVQERPRLLLIKTQRDDDHRVRLTVRDAGVGLPAHGLDSVFDAFYTTKTGGMGIGLFVSRSILERHQGRLWAESNDGPGATFSFSIPSQTG